MPDNKKGCTLHRHYTGIFLLPVILVLEKITGANIIWSDGYDRLLLNKKSKLSSLNTLQDKGVSLSLDKSVYPQ